MPIYIWSSAEQRIIDKSTRETPVHNKRSTLPCPTLMLDIQPFVSPVDGKEITSRSALKAHNNTHNVRQKGNDGRDRVQKDVQKGEGGWKDYKG